MTTIPPADSSSKKLVDLRILQANERTLLAWIRTGISLMAFGFVVARAGVWLRGESAAAAHSSATSWIGAAFVTIGTLSNLLAVVRYIEIRKAILEHQVLIPGNTAVLTIAVGLVILGGILTSYLVL
jgi:putative membrane protein